MNIQNREDFFPSLERGKRSLVMASYGIGKTRRKRAARELKQCLQLPHASHPAAGKSCERMMGMMAPRCPQCGAPN